MKLPFLKKNKNKKEYIITLELRRDSVTAVLLEQINASLTRKAAEEVALATRLQETTTEELIQAADKAISKIEEATPPGTFIKKTLFTVPYEWQEEGKVKKDYLAKLKILCDELELTPIGFLVTIEAIIHFLKEKDGALASAIFIELDKKDLTAFVARGGEIVEVKRLKVETSAITSVENLLRSIDSFEVLPQRLIILRHSGADSLQQELLAHKWPEDIPFLHPPQVQVMDKEFEDDAIFKGIAAQMKLQIAQKQESQATTDEIASKVDAQDLGFHKNVDISDLSEEDKNSISSDNIVIHEPSPDVQEPQQEEKVESEVYKEPSNKKSVPFIKSAKDLLSQPFSKTQSIPIGYKVLPILIIGLLIGLVYGYYSHLLQAEVILYADQKTTEDERDVVLSASDSTGGENIRIETVEIEVEGKKSKSTTGETTTGEKAKGEVTIFNKTENSISLSEGFELTTDDGLTYVLGDDVQIASTSAFSTSFSSKKGSVEAETFGDEYNITENNNFTVTGYSASQVFAKNSEKFSGGSKKEIKVVSQEDISDLEQSLREELIKKARQQAEKDISSKQTLIPEIINFEFDSTNFSHDEGDEASTLNLTASAIITIGFYEDKEIQDYIKGVSTEKAPENYTFVEKNSILELEDIEVNKDEITALAKIKGAYAPSVKNKEIAKELSRKGANQAQQLLREIENIDRFEIIYSRKLPFFPEILPWNTNNINVIVKTD